MASWKKLPKSKKLSIIDDLIKYKEDDKSVSQPQIDELNSLRVAVDEEDEEDEE